MAEAQRKQAEAAALAKAETEAAARRQASEKSQRKAEAEAASRRQADEMQAKAQAEREKVEAEAKIKADARAEADKAATTLAKLKEEGEAAERSLRLEQPERQRLQVALTPLGFDTRGSDSLIGPRSREIVAAWQKKANAPATGFLTAAQRDQLLRSAAPAVTRWDEEQKKIEDEKKKPDATQTATIPNQSGTGASAPPASGPSGAGVAGAGSSRAATLRDGTYGGGLGLYTRALSLELRMSNGTGTGTVTSSTCVLPPQQIKSILRFHQSIAPAARLKGGQTSIRTRNKFYNKPLLPSRCHHRRRTSSSRRRQQRRGRLHHSPPSCRPYRLELTGSACCSRRNKLPAWVARQRSCRIVAPNLAVVHIEGPPE